MCQDAVPSPLRNYWKDQIKLPPGWIYPIFCLQHPPPARSPDSLSVCTAINELPGRALATLGLCEGLRSKRGLISNKYWFVCKWNSSIYGMVLDTQVVTKLLWGQMLSRMLISHLYERQQSRGSKDFCRILHLDHCEEGQRQVYAIYSSSRPRFSPFLNSLKCSGQPQGLANKAPTDPQLPACFRNAINCLHFPNAATE